MGCLRTSSRYSRSHLTAGSTRAILYSDVATGWISSKHARIRKSTSANANPSIAHQLAATAVSKAAKQPSLNKDTTSQRTWPSSTISHQQRSGRRSTYRKPGKTPTRRAQHPCAGAHRDKKTRTRASTGSSCHEPVHSAGYQSWHFCKPTIHSAQQKQFE